MFSRRHPFTVPGLILALTRLVPAAWASEGSIVPLGGCVLCVAPPNSGFKSVATGNYHTMGLRSDGSVAAWGICDVGQCTQPIPNTGFTAISAGDSHSMALRADGSIAVWGNEEFPLQDVPEPNTGYKAISAGLLHNLALRADGSIVQWGYTIWNEPVPAPNQDWVAIAAGGYYSMGLKKDGSIRRWGCNGLCPVPSPNTGFVGMATHFSHSLAVKNDGSVVAWGSNDSGQLDVPAPNAGFVAVSAGDDFSLGLKSDGTLAAWGSLGPSHIPQPNRGYLAMTANKGVFDTLRAPLLDATFSDAPPISTSGGQTPGAVAADIDGDGDQDILAAEYGGDTVALYESNGTSPPIWTKRVIDVAAQGPITVATGDLDGDGDTDVVSANFNIEGVAWYENKGGSPPAWTKRLISGIPGAWGVHVADIDGDGDLDAVGGNRFDPGDHIGVEWYENNGGAPPAFTIHRVSAGFVDAASVHAADLDGDGDGDILAVDVFRDTIFLYENNGAQPPVWTERVLTNATNDPWSVFAADVDGDGDLDVLSASAEDDTIAWYENRGGTPLVFVRRVITTSADQAIAVHAADLDGDADVDVVSGAWSNEIAWYESDGAATPSFTRHVVSNNCRGPEGVFAARLDPDRDLDILAACQIFGEVQWFPNFANFTDADLDGVRDGLDCAPGNVSTFAVPREVREVRFPSATLLTWSSEKSRSGAGTRYDVLRGDIEDLPVGSGPEACLADGTTVETLTEPAIPTPGRGFVYFVRAGNACGTGTYGATTQAVERISTACP